MKTNRIYYVTATTHDGKKSWFGQRSNKRDAVKWFNEVSSKYRDAKLNCKTETVEVLRPKANAKRAFAGGGGAEQVGDSAATQQSGAGSQNGLLSDRRGGNGDA